MRSDVCLWYVNSDRHSAILWVILLRDRRPLVELCACRCSTEKSWMSFRVTLVLYVEVNSTSRVTERPIMQRTEAVRECNTLLNRVQPLERRRSNSVTDCLGAENLKHSPVMLDGSPGMDDCVLEFEGQIRCCMVNQRRLWGWTNGLIELCENDFLVVSGSFVSQALTNLEPTKDLIETSDCSMTCQMRPVMQEMPYSHFRLFKCSVGGFDTFPIIMHLHWMINDKHMSGRERNCHRGQCFIDSLCLKSGKVFPGSFHPAYCQQNVRFTSFWVPWQTSRWTDSRHVRKEIKTIPEKEW
jgi:hypothetical protein